MRRLSVAASARGSAGSAWTALRRDGCRPPAWCTPFPTRAFAFAPKAGAQCVSSARWDLCGGPPARAVPTAISDPWPPSPPSGGGQVRRPLLVAGRGGVPVVVGGRESRSQGEGAQQASRGGLAGQEPPVNTGVPIVCKHSEGTAEPNANATVNDG